MRSPAPVRVVRTLLLSVCVFLVAGCRKPQQSLEPAAVVPELREATAGLLVTWVDEKGDFHTEVKAADVPLVGRDVVRIVDPEHETSLAADKVFLADMRNVRADSTYEVRVAPRAELEKLVEERRQKHSLTFSQVDNGVAPTANAEARRTQVIIYGAEWCGACHEAAAYLKSKGVPFIEKNIEKDAQAAAEMRTKLSNAGLHGGSIPVLDVGGHVLLGFNPLEIERSLKTSR